MQNEQRELSSEQREKILTTLKARFEKNMNRHEGLEWANVQAKLETNAEKLWSLNEMEITGGEPDVINYDKKADVYIFYDCSEQSPKAAEVFVMIERHWSQGKSINRKITLWIWLQTWVLRF